MASGGGEEGEFGLQIAPLLDLLFVLLLFFMVTASQQVKETELGIKLPSSGSSPGTPDTPITLGIDVGGQVSFNQTPIDAPKNHDLPDLKQKLADAIRQFGEKQAVIIAPNPHALEERVIDVLNACSAAGVKNISFGSGS
ncbi:MAG TPA: biopolymer transporter ExbD [Candidatus Methylacidiphilales bacterium]